MTRTFTIDTEVAQTYFKDLLEFIYQYYILPRKQDFTNVKRPTIDHDPVLSFTLSDPRGKWYVGVELRGRKPIQVMMTPGGEEAPPKVLDQIREDLILNVQLFEEKIRKTTLYFAWVEGEKVIVEKIPSKRRSIIDRMFSESMLLLFIIFIAASILFFWVFGSYAPIFLVVLQFVIILFSDRLIMRMGDWVITPQNPRVHLLQYHLPVEEYEEFQRKYGKDLITEMKKDIYEETFAVGRELNCDTAGEVFSRYGIECIPKNMSTKTLNLYRLVEEAAGRFGASTPKIVVSNTMLPNAAATGLSPSRGVILLTTGLLVQLGEDEILSVVGHEFSHLKGRDPLILFTLTTFEYLIRVYLLLPFIPFLYFIFAMGVVYFIAKFFEARADLESAIRIGQPHVLAEALRKIGFRKLQFERTSASRIQGWLGWDPHPPTYFRIARLEGLEAQAEVRHPLIQSIKDVIKGFRAAF